MAEKLEKALKKRNGFETQQQEAVISILFTNELFQHRFGQFFRKHGLNQAQYNLLRILKGEGKPMRSLEIAQRMITVVPAITSSIKSLQKKGYVLRERSDDDRRVFYVSLTAAGKKLLAKMAAPNLDMHNELVGHMSNKQLVALTNLLEIARGDLKK
jgi:DNA-binding MarR family transcriptional regulator